MYQFPYQFPRPHTLKIKRLRRPCLIEEKIDGWRMMLWKEHAYGRNPDSLNRWINRWNNLPDHLQALATVTPVDGELDLPGKAAAEVVTGLKERSAELRFIGFRIANRKLLPHEHLNAVKDLGIPIPSLLAPSYLDNRTISPHTLLRQAEEKNIEGWVLKEAYTVSFWWKLKRIRTYDLIVADLRWAIAGRNAQRGWIKSLTCTAYVKGQLKVVANVSGMKDQVRAQISKKDIGRVVEVRANLLTSKGCLKHPRFIRWRDDKSKKECILDQ